MTELKDLYIIIAEDDLDDGEIIMASFTKNACFAKVDLVKNGIELLDLLRKAGLTKPDVILTDINMPIMNGIEALAQISDDPVLCGIPAFVYSTSINPVYEAKCMSLGIKGFLVKPFNLTEFDDIPNKIAFILSQNLEDKI